MEVPDRTSVISAGDAAQVRPPSVTPQRLPPRSAGTHLISITSPQGATSNRPIYSLRIMSIARGGLPAHLGSTVLFDPLFMLAAVGRSSQMRRPVFCLSPAGVRCVKSPLQKERPQSSHRGISVSRTPRNTCCNVWTRLCPAVIGQSAARRSALLGN